MLSIRTRLPKIKQLCENVLEPLERIEIGQIVKFTVKSDEEVKELVKQVRMAQVLLERRFRVSVLQYKDKHIIFVKRIKDKK